MACFLCVRSRHEEEENHEEKRRVFSTQQRGKAEENNANLKGPPPPGWRKKANTQWEIHQHLKPLLSKFRCFQFEIQAGDDDDQDQEETNCIPSERRGKTFPEKGQN